MQLRIVLIQFYRDFRSQRLRTALTLFGLGWGTFCVILLLSFGEGVQRKQMEHSAAMGDRIILIWGSRTSIPYEGLPRGRYIMLEDGDADALKRQIPEVTAASPEYGDQVRLQGPKGETTANLSGVRPEFSEMRKVEPAEGGRFLNERDETERRRVVFLGNQVREDLFGAEPCIGKTLEISGIPFTVVGTMPAKRQDSNYNGRDDNKAFVSSAVAQASLGLRWPNNLVVEVAPDADSKQVVKKINAVMGKLHHYDAADEEALAVWDVGDMLKEVLSIFLGFKAFLAILGALTLMVAGIGVSNIMSMVVEDRTSQIGISMALGARKGWVLGQILLETLVVVGVGGALGVAFALGIVRLAAFLPINDEIGTPVFSWQIAVLTAALLGTIGIVSGMGPARRAAGLNPAAALRS